MKPNIYLCFKIKNQPLNFLQLMWVVRLNLDVGHACTASLTQTNSAQWMVTRATLFPTEIAALILLMENMKQICEK